MCKSLPCDTHFEGMKESYGIAEIWHWERLGDATSVVVKAPGYCRYLDHGMSTMDSDRYAMELIWAYKISCVRVTDSRARDETAQAIWSPENHEWVQDARHRAFYTVGSGVCLDFIITVSWFFPFEIKYVTYFGFYMGPQLRDRIFRRKLLSLHFP